MINCENLEISHFLALNNLWGIQYPVLHDLPIHAILMKYITHFLIHHFQISKEKVLKRIQKIDFRLLL